MSRHRKQQAKRQTRPGKGVKTHFKKRTPGPAAPDPASPFLLLSLFLLHPVHAPPPPPFLRALCGPTCLPPRYSPLPKPLGPTLSHNETTNRKNTTKKGKSKRKVKTLAGRVCWAWGLQAWSPDQTKPWDVPLVSPPSQDFGKEFNGGRQRVT